MNISRTKKNWSSCSWVLCELSSALRTHKKEMQFFLEKKSEWHQCPWKAIKYTIKWFSSGFRPPSRDGGDCFLNSPVVLFRLKRTILENSLHLSRERMCFDRKVLSKFDQLWCPVQSCRMLSLPAVNVSSIVNRQVQYLANEDDEATMGGDKKCFLKKSQKPNNLFNCALRWTIKKERESRGV